MQRLAAMLEPERLYELVEAVRRRAAEGGYERGKRTIRDSLKALLEIR